MPKIFLTDEVVFEAICPDDKDQEFFWDYAVAANGQIHNGSVSGLGLRVTALGHKAFVHAYRFNGKRCRSVLGTAAVLSVASARLAVISREQELEAGRDPDVDRVDPRRKHFQTIAEVIDRYWETHVKELSEGVRYSFTSFVGNWLRQENAVNKRGYNQRKNYTAFGAMYADRSLSSIKPTDVERFQAQFASPYVYNRALGLVSALFNWAIRIQLVDMRNPCHPLRKKKIIRRRRDYSTEQIRQIAAHVFYPSVEVLPEVDHLEGYAKRDMALRKAWLVTANDQMLELCNYMGILFLTMARPSDLNKAEFDHFDLEKLIWHKHNTKGIQLSRSLYEMPIARSLSTPG